MTVLLASSDQVVWIFFFLVLYWAYCLFWGFKRARETTGAIGFFLAGRELGPWPFVAGATTAAFAGWLFAALPGLVFRDGLVANYLGYAAIVIPLGGTLLMKRQWVLSRRHGFVTPGEMFGAYFGSDVIRVFTAVVALLFAVPFLAMLLGVGAQLLSAATGGALPRDLGLWVLAAPMLIYVTAGGLGAVAEAGRLQVVLIVVGVVLLGLAALNLVGGFDAMNQALARIGEAAAGRWGTTGGHGGGDFSGALAVAGVAQWTRGLGLETPAGGVWTSLMILSFLIAFLGVPASPLFSLWAFSSREVSAFAAHQVWASAGVMGLVFSVFVALIGVGGLLLGADGELADQGLQVTTLLPALAEGQEWLLPAAFVNLIGAAAPWLGGLLVVCLLVAVTASGGAFVTASGAVLTRDLFMHFFHPKAGDRLQQQFARVIMLITTVLAVLMATFAEAGTAALAALALPLSAQILPAFLGLLWVPWLTRAGIVAGLLTGALVVVLTDPLGQLLTAGALPWGHWPWTIHSAGWGLVANALVAAIGSGMARGEQSKWRYAHHVFLDQHARRPRASGHLIAAAAAAAMAWLFFAVGPGSVLGNYLFGAPDAGQAGWAFAMPSLWAWQLIWWGLGVLLVWLLAYTMQLGTLPGTQVTPLVPDAALSRREPRYMT